MIACGWSLATQRLFHRKVASPSRDSNSGLWANMPLILATRPLHCCHKTPNWPQPPKPTPTQTGYDRWPHCSWCPTQLDTSQHLLHYSRRYSHRIASLHSLSSLHFRRATVIDVLGDSQNPGLAFKVLKHTRTFLQRINSNGSNPLTHLLPALSGIRGCGESACTAPSNSQEDLWSGEALINSSHW